MTAMITPNVYYPSGDGQPVAETFDHLYVILITIEVLRLYLEEVQACVLGNQYLYYQEDNWKKRCAPDVMVIFGVAPGSRDNYKIWEEGEVPQIVFEMTSEGTRKDDEVDKKLLYAEIGIQEYWQFDPKGEWIKENLRGFRLVNGAYVAIENSISTVLNLRFEVAGALISFYRLDNGEKLLIPKELQEKADRAQEQLQITLDRLKLEQAQLQIAQDCLKLEQDRSQILEAQLEEQSLRAEAFRSEAEISRSESAAFQAELAKYRDRFGDL